MLIKNEKWTRARAAFRFGTFWHVVQALPFCQLLLPSQQSWRKLLNSQHNLAINNNTNPWCGEVKSLGNETQPNRKFMWHEQDSKCGSTYDAVELVLLLLLLLLDVINSIIFH